MFGQQAKAKAVKEDNEAEDEHSNEDAGGQEEAAEHAETATEQPKPANKAVVRPSASTPSASDDKSRKASKAKKKSST